MTPGNGIILSPDEKTLYVTNGGVVLAFDVQADGSLTNQREFGMLRGGPDERCSRYIAIQAPPFFADSTAV